MQKAKFSKSKAFRNSRNPKDFGISEKLGFSEDLREVSLLGRLSEMPKNMRFFEHEGETTFLLIS